MSRSVRRLMKEAAELTTSPSPHFTAHPVSESNLYDWHFTLEGPPAPSPYAGGIYHGRIILPSTYPLRPPSFRFLTPSGRFEVNREICLSISGHHEETWQPAWGIRTALLAIRSFMDGDVRGQVGGLEVSDEVRREHAKASRGWCCEICGRADGNYGRMKTNEEVLKEWQEFCREKGINIEGEGGKEEVPSELRLGVSKPSSTSTPAESAAEKSNAAGDSANTGLKDSTSDSMGAPATLAKEEPVSSASSMSLARQQQQQVTPTPTTTSTSTSLVVPPVPRAATVPAPVQSQDSPWLDRAIIGVLVALVLMVLRRVANVEDY